MSNAKLINAARQIVMWNQADEVYGDTDDLLTRLADALEAADSDHYDSERTLIDTVNRQADLIEQLEAAERERDEYLERFRNQMQAASDIIDENLNLKSKLAAISELVWDYDVWQALRDNDEPAVAIWKLHAVIPHPRHHA